MTPYLLLDFGTTSTKSTIVDLDTGSFSEPQSHPSIPGVEGPTGHYEIPLPEIRDRFLSICTHYCDALDIHFHGIVLCSEMHGFAALGEEDQPLTNYISWKDDRSLEEINGISSFDVLTRELGNATATITGMKPRTGFALLNLLHLGRAGRLPYRGRVVSLPGWLARCSENATCREHPTLLAGMAFYDVRENALSDELIDMVRNVTGFTSLLDSPALAGQVAGYWHRRGEKIPICVGVGDHQCSVLGAGLTDDSISFNLGTGSQISVLDGKNADETVETRPFFDGHYLQTITAVPAGRALNEYVGFLDEVSGGNADFWTLLDKMSAADVLRSDLDFDLRLFPGARDFGDGGGITRIREGRLNLHNYLASLLRSFAAQYREIAAVLDPDHTLSRCLLGGGIARNLPHLRNLIAHFTGYEVLPAAPLDESILGLRTLALVAAGCAPTCLEAQEIFGRKCRIDEL